MREVTQNWKSNKSFVLKFIKAVSIILIAIWHVQVDATRLINEVEMPKTGMDFMPNMNNQFFAQAKSVESTQSNDEMRQLNTITFEKDPNDILLGMG